MSSEPPIETGPADDEIAPYRSHPMFAPLGPSVKERIGAGDRTDRHDAEAHDWVVRTADSDQMSTRTRLVTSWPLLKMYAMRQVRLRYSQSVLGFSWTFVQPIAIMAIYGFVFTQFLEVDGGGQPYLAVAWTGLTVWMYVQATVQQGTVALRNDAWLLGRVWFPREIIPLAPVLGGLIDLAVAAGILVAIVLVQGVGLSYHLIALPFVLAVLLVWVAALSLLTATITIFFRDMATIVSLGLRLAFIATPVMYPAKFIPDEFGWVTAANPFAQVVENTRAIVLAHVWPNWEILLLHGAVGGALLAISLWYLRAVERRMVDVI